MTPKDKDKFYKHLAQFNQDADEFQANFAVMLLIVVTLALLVFVVWYLQGAP